MTKKNQQSSGPSYSLLALLKRTLFLHETSNVEELVEEVHEYMLKDQSYEQIKDRYVEPILRSNPSFHEVEAGKNIWKLTEGNKVNDAVYEVFRKYKAPLSERQILNRIAKVKHIAGNINVKLDLKNDARFADLEGGKYWILSEWVVINDYARSILMRNKAGLTEKDIINKVVGEFRIDKDSAIFIPMLDERFVQKEKKWVLQRFVEQKTKLRPSQIDRLYQYLLKVDKALEPNELTASVLNIPASSTDVDEKLAQDPRFVLEDGLWDLRSRVKFHQIQKLEAKEAQEQAVPPISLEVQPEFEQPEAPQIFPSFEAALLSQAAGAMTPEVASPGVFAQPEVRIEGQDLSVIDQEFVPQAEATPEQAPEFIEAEEATIAEQAQALPVIQEEESREAITEGKEELEEESEEAEEEAIGPIDEYAETLRSKVVEFLQDAFHTEGIVYNVDIIDQLVSAENKEELFRQFVLDHFVNPAKERVLTHTDLLKFLVYFAEPSLTDKVIDPCCGTGGFLLQILETLDNALQEAEWTERDFALQYELRTGQFYFIQINEEEREYFDFPLDDAVARWLPIIRFCKQQQLTGVDIDRFACRTADLNLAIQGFPEIVIHHDDALNSKQIGSGVYDLVIGNPPSTGDKPTRFLRKTLLLAKPGGKILLLLPNEMFHEHRLLSATLRNQILAQTVVKAVICFPEFETSKLYGQGQTLLYCLRKHHDAEQHSDIFVGDVTSFEALREVIEVMEDPDAPVCQDEISIAGRVVNYILSSYQGSAYNLLLESLRRRALHGRVLSVKEWGRMKKGEHPAVE
ncbi:N-6 DNA methylase [Candidatus Vecturithrix granuli]|uniref:N-6 DNA methylase n=1 Tax=Vecturithrix granuli TaxID=1499967 RepID=A0A081BYK3_VECG1|nr:N-6 DNA methylase [Candidatus Vecturithrix granuli]